MHRICRAAKNEAVFFAYRVAMPRQRFSNMNAFSTKFSKDVTQYDTPDRDLNIIKLKPQPGLYHLSVKDAQNRYYPVFSPPVKNVYEQSDAASCFNQYFAPGYFYVPKGIKTLYVRNNLYFKLKALGWDKPREYKTC